MRSQAKLHDLDDDQVLTATWGPAVPAEKSTHLRKLRLEFEALREQYTIQRMHISRQADATMQSDMNKALSAFDAACNEIMSLVKREIAEKGWTVPARFAVTGKWTETGIGEVSRELGKIIDEAARERGTAPLLNPWLEQVRKLIRVVSTEVRQMRLSVESSQSRPDGCRPDGTAIASSPPSPASTAVSDGVSVMTRHDTLSPQLEIGNNPKSIGQFLQ